MILLVAVNAKYIHSNPAIYSLKKYADAKGRRVALSEYTINNSIDHILQDIYMKNPEVICFSCYIWNISILEELTSTLFNLKPDTPIWLGGPEVSYDAKDFLESHPYIKGIMCGEGEESFRKLCDYYESKDTGNKLKDVAGLVFRDNEKIISTGASKYMDMDEIPFYYDDIGIFENRIVYYESSRGCPFSCSYCLSSIEKKVRLRSIEIVKEELGFFLKKNVHQVKFIDRTFNCNSKHAYDIWKFIKENDNGITNFHFEISADLLTKEQIELLNTLRPGLVQLEIGVQTTNEKTIKEINRTMELDRLRKNVDDISKAKNIHQHLDLIAGLPYEDYESFRKSFNDIFALRPNQLQLGFLKVLKGSLMQKNAVQYGLVYKQKPPYEVLKTNWISYNDMIKIKGAEEVLEVYYNSGQYVLSMEILLSLSESPFDFFVMLGEFYRRMGYISMSFSRLSRCEKLLEYLESKEYQEISDKKPDIDMIKEALIFDLYSRENCKSRPAWAVDKNELKEMTKIHCGQRGRKAHVEPFSYDFDKILAGEGKQPHKLEGSRWLLFDYEKIDSITNSAAVSVFL